MFEISLNHLKWKTLKIYRHNRNTTHTQRETLFLDKFAANNHQLISVLEKNLIAFGELGM